MRLKTLTHLRLFIERRQRLCSSSRVESGCVVDISPRPVEDPDTPSLPHCQWCRCKIFLVFINFILFYFILSFLWSHPCILFCFWSGLRHRNTSSCLYMVRPTRVCIPCNHPPNYVSFWIAPTPSSSQAICRFARRRALSSGRDGCLHRWRDTYVSSSLTSLSLTQWRCIDIDHHSGCDSRLETMILGRGRSTVLFLISVFNLFLVRLSSTSRSLTQVSSDESGQDYRPGIRQKSQEGGRKWRGRSRFWLAFFAAYKQGQNRGGRDCVRSLVESGCVIDIYLPNPQGQSEDPDTRQAPV